VLLNVGLLVAAIGGIGQYGILKNIYIHPWLSLTKRQRVRETGPSSGPSASYRWWLPPSQVYTQAKYVFLYKSKRWLLPYTNAYVYYV